MKAKTAQKDIAGFITKAGKTEQVGEFKYPYDFTGFFVTIAFGSRFVLNQIRQLAVETVPDRRTRTTEERLDDEKLQLGYAERIVKDWRGLDVEGLERLVPGTFDAVLLKHQEKKEKESEYVIPSMKEIGETEVEYSVETAASVLANSIDFMNWIVEIAGNTSNYAKTAEQKEKEYKNLK